MSGKGNRRQKGKGLPVSGIPLAGAISQVEESSAEPNRIEALNAFHEDQEAADPRPYDQRDYIGDEEDRLGNSDMYIADKNDEEWSDGLEDEANIADEATDEGMFAEIQPLHIDLASTAGLGEDDNFNVSLRPDTVDNGGDDFTVLVDRKLSQKLKGKKSA